ncbi:MAG TPA: sugar phosphate isomerase/epimerase [Planctomycetota bacterium]|nr:sugar phosphate isomerase/epimerase [Planctomycetota bacterium]
MQSRRSFLGSVAGIGAAGALAPQLLAAEAKERWPMRLSTSSNHFRQLPLEEACERIGTLGFEAIDIWSAYQGCPHLDHAKDKLGADGLKELLAKHNLKLFAFSTYVGGYARYAELLGAAGGGVAVQGSAGAAKPEELTDRMKRFLESCKPLVELCEKHNSYLAIENHGGSLLCTIDSFKAFVDLNQSPRLGIALAPYHVQAGKMSVEDAIRACGKQLLFFYAWQHAPGVNELPGYGPTDFVPWLKALADFGYAGCVNVFTHHHLEADAMSAALAKARDYVKDCYAKCAAV